MDFTFTSKFSSVLHPCRGQKRRIGLSFCFLAETLSKKPIDYHKRRSVGVCYTEIKDREEKFLLLLPFTRRIHFIAHKIKDCMGGAKRSAFYPCNL